MPRLLIALTLLLMADLAPAAENTLTPAEKRGGWKLLFDGKTTEGWRNYREKSIHPEWEVVDGALTKSKSEAGNIVTKDKYGSFELSLEYKISKGGNSGIMFHVNENNDNPWQSGPEIQVQDNVDGHDPQKSGWLYQLYPAMPEPFTGRMVDSTRPVGEWNQVVIRVTPVGGEINMNGYRYSMFNKGDDDWNQRVAKSKFKDFPDFGKEKEGYICLQGDHGGEIAYRNIKIRELPDDGIPPNPIDGELPLKVELAFPKLQWTGFGDDESGRVEALRPILLTHAGDGSNRIFVPTQQGVIHVFANDPGADKTTVFADLSDRVTYKDNENEEGLLGLAFHPKYKETGEFFVYYTSSKLKPHTSVISRFRVSKSDANKADAMFEEELMQIPEPYWNHNGGTLCFGPDGYLYIALGDGGAADDPHGNGQNASTLLGSILRIDVDHKENGKNYAIPKDNPFAGQKDKAQEIYAIGLRNPWRIAFDRETGHLWCGDVGQNLWEEIDIITNGGNYGWSLREGTHPFGPVSSEGRTDLIEPIWEYDHQTGKSITGGVVYRGKKLPELAGKYIYADYVSGRIWALHYDEVKKEVITNEGIPSEMMPVMSFGEDEQGEVYFTIVSANGHGIYTFAKAK
jgi:glucose/arabinose dehydrogenase